MVDIKKKCQIVILCAIAIVFPCLHRILIHIERIHKEIINKALKICVVRNPMLQHKNITFLFFPPDLVQQQPIHGYAVITSGWVIVYQKYNLVAGLLSDIVIERPTCSAIHVTILQALW